MVHCDAQVNSNPPPSELLTLAYFESVSYFFLLSSVHLAIIRGCDCLILGVGDDTLSDSIRYLNSAEKWFNSTFDSMLLTQNSIQTITQFNIDPSDSIQKKIQFNILGIIDTGRIRKVPKKCPKKTEMIFLSKIKCINSINDSFLHFTIKFNSKGFPISILSQIFNFLHYGNNKAKYNIHTVMFRRITKANLESIRP